MCDIEPDMVREVVAENERLTEQHKEVFEVNMRQAHKINAITGARHEFHNKLTLLLGGDTHDDNFSVCDSIELLKAERDQLREYFKDILLATEVVDSWNRPGSESRRIAELALNEGELN